MNALAATAPYSMARKQYVLTADMYLPPPPARCARCNRSPDVAGDVHGIDDAGLIVVGYAVVCPCGATGPVRATAAAACVAWSTAQWRQYADVEAVAIDPEVEEAAKAHRRAVVRECARRFRERRRKAVTA